MPDLPLRDASLATAASTLTRETGEEIMAVAFIGERGCERVWLHANIHTPEQCAWAAKHLRAAADIAERMAREGPPESVSYAD